MAQNDLIIKENIKSVDVFKIGGTDPIIKAIELEIEKHVPDVSTLKGRKEIASLAAKVSSSKTFLDKMGKELKAEYKAVIDPIDSERKKMRDALDVLRDKARKPLTEWEAEQERIKAEKKAQEEFENDWVLAIADNELFNREREIKRKEEKLRRIEEERKAKEEAERIERERVEYEEHLKKEAAEKAVRDAEEKIRKEKEEAERKIREAKDREEQLKREAEQAEKNRFAEIEAEKVRVENARIEAIKLAEREKQEALDKQRKEQEEKERIERERITEEKRIAEEKAANLNHRKSVNNKIVKKLMHSGITEEQAKAIITEIVLNPIAEITINY